MANEILLVLLAILSVCKSEYEVSKKYRSIGFADRKIHAEIKFLILHYTGAPLPSSLNELTHHPEKSIHYLVPTTSTNGSWLIYQLVDESKTAWHAGVTKWQDYTRLNDYSIGIEIVNKGIPDPYPEDQINILIELLTDLISRHNICQTCILGHSDVAPSRKIDPGPLFPWKKLYDKGIGFWPASLNETEIVSTVNVSCTQTKLKMIGYNITVTGKMDIQTGHVLKALMTRLFSSPSCDLNVHVCRLIDSVASRYYNQTDLLCC